MLQQQRLIFLIEIRCCGLAEEDRGDEGQEMERKEREAVSLQFKCSSDYLQALVRLCMADRLVRHAQQKHFMVAQPPLDVQPHVKLVSAKLSLVSTKSELFSFSPAFFIHLSNRWFRSTGKC